MVNLSEQRSGCGAALSPGHHSPLAAAEAVAARVVVVVVVDGGRWKEMKKRL